MKPPVTPRDERAAREEIEAQRAESLRELASGNIGAVQRRIASLIPGAVVNPNPRALRMPRD